MGDKGAYNSILFILVFVGGFFISFTVYAFIVFARFLDREKLAAERFRAEHRVSKERGTGAGEG